MKVRLSRNVLTQLKYCFVVKKMIMENKPVEEVIAATEYVKEVLMKT